MARFDLTDFEWSVIQPLLPTGRAGFRGSTIGACSTASSGGCAPARRGPTLERYRPYTTCVNRFNRWRRAGVWDRLLEAVSKAYDGDIR